MPQSKRKAKPTPSPADTWRGQDIIIKFSENISASERGKMDAITWITKSGLGAFDKLALDRTESLEPLFDMSLLEAVTKTALARDTSYSPSKLENYFVLRTGPGRCNDEAIEQIRCWHEVEEVYPAPRVGPPPGAINQNYLRCATQGVGFFTASGARLSVSGVNGDGIQFGDLEEGWGTHPLMPPRGTPFPDAGYNKNAYPEHGRRCVGIVSALPPNPTDPNPYFSIAPGAITRFYSPWYKPALGPATCNIAQGILQSFGPGSRQLHYGDILLIEMQVISGGFCLPVEITSDVYNVIRLATAYGIIVVEPAGTNPAGMARNINSYLYGPDSGALVVGAADDFHNTLPESNYGLRVDFHAPGMSPLTVLGPDATTLYEDVPGPGTSWSAAIVAGVAVSAQGMVRANSADPTYRLGPAVMKHLLASSSATPCADPMLPVGVMPNLVAIATNFGAIADVYIRDDFGDNGSPRPDSTIVTLSPDITVRQTELSVTEQNDTLHNFSQPVPSGTLPILYARFFNRVPSGSAGGELHNVEVSFFFAPASPLPLPSTWSFLGKNASTLLLMPGTNAVGRITSSLPITTAGTIVAVLSSVEDSTPDIHDLTIGSWLQIVKNNNNLAMRTFDLATTVAAATVASGTAATTGTTRTLTRATTKSKNLAEAGTSTSLYVEISGADRGLNVMDVEIRTVLPDHSQLRLEAPASVMQRLLRGKPPHVAVERIERVTAERTTKEKNKNPSTGNPAEAWEVALAGESEIWSVPLLSRVPNTFKDVQLPCRYRGAMRIQVTIPKDAQLGARRVTVRQLLECTEVGSFTFNLAPEDSACPEGSTQNQSAEATDDDSPDSTVAAQRRGRQPARRGKR